MKVYSIFINMYKNKLYDENFKNIYISNIYIDKYLFILNFDWMCTK